jgi:hypothetical protein
MDDDGEHFSDMAPTSEIEDMLSFLVVPSRAELRQFLKEFGQAWFDGKKSIRTWINPEIACPFWVLTYWGEILDAMEARDRWQSAAFWLERRGKTTEELVLKRTVQGLWRIIGWHGSVHGFDSVAVSDLASLFSQDYLGGNLVDAMLSLLSMRLKAAGGPIDTTVIVNTTFGQMIDLLCPREDGKLPISSHPGAQKYLKKYGTWFRSPDHTQLHFVLYRPPTHWTACAIDFKAKHIRYGDSLKWKRPKDFFLALKSWTTENFPDIEFAVTDDLPCAVQTDGYNCPLISVNTVAHNTLGDPLWTPKMANALRMQAFCDIAKHALCVKVSIVRGIIETDTDNSLKRTATSKCQTVDNDDLAENLLAVTPDINDTLMDDKTVAGSNTGNNPGAFMTSIAPVKLADAAPIGGTKGTAEPSDTETVERGSSAKASGAIAIRDTVSEPVDTAPVQTKKRSRAAELDDGDERKRKVAKTSESSARKAAAASHPIFQKGFKAGEGAPAKKGKKPDVQVAKTESSSNVGISKSASAARQQRADIRSGNFAASAKKTENFQKKCRAIDKHAGFEETCKKVQCSTCKSWVAMQDAYCISRFKKHVEAKKCSLPAPVAPPPSTLENFDLAPTRPAPKKPPPAPTVMRPCPGLTHAFDEAVGNYLDRTVSTGGGAHSVNHYSSKFFKKDFTELTQKEKETVYSARFHDYTWRNDVSPGIMACFAAGTTPCLRTVEIDPNSTTTPPCSSCRLLATQKAFKNAIRIQAPEPANLKYVPHTNQNPHAGMLYAKFKGLDALISEVYFPILKGRTPRLILRQDNEWSLERRYFQHVVNGDFKDDKVFNGIIQAKVMAKDREIKGVGMQNFKYNSDMDAVFGLIHTISPRAYRELSKHFPMRTERSIKCVLSYFCHATRLSIFLGTLYQRVLAFPLASQTKHLVMPPSTLRTTSTLSARRFPSRWMIPNSFRPFAHFMMV